MTARCLILVAALLLALPALPSGIADPGPGSPELWAHARGDNTLWMSSDRMDDRGALETWGDNLPDMQRIWVFPLDPPLERTLLLDQETRVRFTMIMGGSDRVGRFAVSTVLAYDDVIIAEGRTDNVTFAAGYQKVIVDAPPLVEEVPHYAGQVTWTVTAQGAWDGLFMALGGREGHSNVRLPITATAATGSGDLDRPLETPAPWALLPLAVAVMARRRTDAR